jgi:ADP-ribose pyrophosphatase YjhB (NUDIX family)
MWQPDVTVSAICERNGRFLIVEERSKSSGQLVLNQPAGHLEDGESILQAVIRETLEETCYHFKPEAIVGFYRLRTSTGKTYLRYTFCGSVGELDGSIVRDPDILDTHWLEINQLQKSKILRSELVFTCIQDYLAGIRHPLEILREL